MTAPSFDIKSTIMILKDIIKELLFPRYCVGCGKIFTFLCPKCYEQIEFVTLPIQPTLDQVYIDKLISAAYFQPPISNLIKAMKYNSIPDMSLTCAKLLFRTVNFSLPDLVTSVPLHKHRQAERGFNQAELIGQEFAKLIHKPYFNLLKRKQEVPHQAGIENKEERKNNVKNIFDIDWPTNWSQNINKQTSSLMIVDDVTTTGATLNECARILKKNGFQHITGLTVAHGS